MNLLDVFKADAIAANWTEVASNSIPYFGSGLFPAKKKAGLDLKWFKGNKGLPVSLMPSNFDAKSTFRDRIGMSMDETEMPFFRESMLVKESDEQEVMRAKDSNDPYVIPILENIFNDAKMLVDGANVVPERMIMQLLAPKGGKVGISIVANNTDYTYNYDPSGDWKKENYKKITTATAKWSASDTCDPLADLEAAIEAVSDKTGDKPEVALMSKKTFNYIKKSEAIKEAILAQNTTVNVRITNSIVKDFILADLGLTIVIYEKKFKNEKGVISNFYPDDIVMLMPDSELGNTWYGTTPEERTLSQKEDADVSIVNTGVTVSVTITSDPVNTKTTVSEIVLPSFERLNECYGLEVC